jgi:predicted TIM-barrel fold metal-dependent hydrolase
MPLHRREFLHQTAGCLAAGTLVARASANQGSPPMLIVDTHQHLWDLSKLKLPWLADAPEVLRHTFRNEEYRQATEGLNVKAVYMEVDVAAEQHVDEAEHVIGLCREGRHPTMAAVIGGRPASPQFGQYLQRFKGSPHVKGVRQVLHNPSAKPGTCLQDDFVRGVRLLGEQGLSFDLCMRPAELQDALRLTELCPDTRFIVDHCGNADPKAFRKSGDEKPTHDPEAWKSDMERLARRPNTICKISGIVARAPKGWQADDLAPIVNHCLDAFGPDRVVFGGDWPVCLLGSSLRGWIDALRHIVATRPAGDQHKLWSANAVRFYGLKIAS